MSRPRTENREPRTENRALITDYFPLPPNGESGGFLRAKSRRSPFLATRGHPVEPGFPSERPLIPTARQRIPPTGPGFPCAPAGSHRSEPDSPRPGAMLLPLAASLLGQSPDSHRYAPSSERHPPPIFTYSASKASPPPSTKGQSPSTFRPPPSAFRPSAFAIRPRPAAPCSRPSAARHHPPRSPGRASPGAASSADSLFIDKTARSGTHQPTIPPPPTACPSRHPDAHCPPSFLQKCPGGHVLTPPA